MAIRKRTVSQRIGQGVLIAFMVLISLIVLYPFINMIAISLSENSAIRSGKVSIIPLINKDQTYKLGVIWDAYKLVATNKLIYTGYFNTIKICLIGCSLSLLLTCFAAYPMAFIDFKLKKIYTQFIVITMWFSAGTIPNYMVMDALGLIDSHWSLILGALLSGYNIIILRGYFYGIPKSLVESAKLDGANDFTILFKIIMPTSLPILATISLWIIVGHWNSYQAPLLYIQTQDKTRYVLQQILASIIRSADSSDFDLSQNPNLGIEQVRNAALLFTTLPILILFPFVQKFLVSGAMVGAVKE